MVNKRKTYPFTAPTSRIARKTDGTASIVKSFAFKGMVLDGTLWVMLTRDAIVTGDIYTTCPYDERLVDRLSELMNNSGKYEMAIYRDKASKYRGVVVDEYGTPIFTTPALETIEHVIGNMERVMSHADYYTYVVEPALFPTPKALEAAPMPFRHHVIACAGVVAAALALTVTVHYNLIPAVRSFFIW